MAVLQQLQDDGLGSYLVDLICGLVSDTPFAVRLITVDAINHDDVIGFYAKVGFIESLNQSLNQSPARVGMVFLPFLRGFRSSVTRPLPAAT